MGWDCIGFRTDDLLGLRLTVGIGEGIDMDIAESILHLTVRIEAKRLDGTVITGTGFYFDFCVKDEMSIPAIVTNKHVVENADSMIVLFSVFNEDGTIAEKKERLEVGGMLGHWSMHPDPDVDLCVLPIAKVLTAFAAAGKQLAIAPLNASFVADSVKMKSLSAIEDITMVGYPNGLWDNVNNLPIVRRGITATPVGSDYCGKKEFLIDSACYPGSSGSPVLLFNDDSYREGDRIVLGSRLLLLGVLYAVPVRSVEGTITVGNIPRVYSQGMLNLGYAIKAERLLEFEPILMAR